MTNQPTEQEVLAQLKAFVQSALPAEQVDTAKPLTLTPISGDAGFRQYFRLNTLSPLLAVWAPTETENSHQFCRVSEFLDAHGVRAPRILAVDFDAGFLVVEDFGNDLLQTQLNEQSVEGYYSEALSMLLHLQSVPENDWRGGENKGLFDEYNEALLERELRLFDEWYLKKLLGIELSAAQSAMLSKVYGLLVDRAVAQKQVVVHRDFHCRNLLVLESGALATIDFQDAVAGPYTYDLVSLLKDCYVGWGYERTKKWALTYAIMAQNTGLIAPVSETDFLQDFDWMGLQRHIKVLGIFARLHLRDGKQGYLPDLPRVLAYVVEACAEYPEFDGFSEFLQSDVKPAISKLPDSLAMIKNEI